MTTHPTTASSSASSGGDCVWVVEILNLQGANVGQAKIDPDWAPAIEAANLDRLRRFPPISALCAYSRGVIEPLYHAAARAPFTSGARVTLPLPDGDVMAVDLPLEYFGDLAQALANQLVRMGKLSPGEEFRYLVCAYPRPGSEDAQPSSRGLSVEELEQPLPIAALDRRSLLAEARTSGSFTPGDLEVIIPESVLVETGVLSRGARDVETGGFLIGNLARDIETGNLFALVTAQIPAQNTVAAAARLTFTPDCWTAASAAISIRNRGELMLGWWHSHPVAAWAVSDQPSGEAVEFPQSHGTHTPFFSSMDCHLHRVCFSRAYHLGLVVTVDTDALNWSLFGWRQGWIQHRHYHIIPDLLPTEEEDQKELEDARVS